MTARVRDYVPDWSELTSRQRYGIVSTVVLVLLVVPLLEPGFFVMNVFIFIFLFAVLGHAWNLIGGYTGQLSLGHAVFFGFGAYTTTLLFLRYGVTPWIGLWIGGTVAALTGLVIGAVTFRLRGHYFAMATLALALIARTAFVRWEWVGGISGLEFPFETVGTLYSFTFVNKLPYFYVIGTFAALVTLLVYVIDRSKLGVYLKAIDMNQKLAENAGLNVFYYKLYALCLSAFITGVGGGLYALYITFISPVSTMDLFRNVEPVIVTLIGGSATVVGPILGAVVFIPVREYTRTFLSGSSTGLGWVIFALVIILFAIYRPGGIVNRYTGRDDEN